MFSCGLCNFETDSEMGWKSHRSKSHGPYSMDDMKTAGIKPSQRDIARSLAGNTSAKEVSEQAPDAEPKIGETGPTTRTRRPRAPAVDPEVEAAKERIIRARCSRMAGLPYSLLAAMLGDPSIRLTEMEGQELTEAYVTLSKAYGWEFTSKLLLWGDVAIVHAAIIAQRKDAIFDGLGLNTQPADVAEQTEEAVTVQ